MPIATFIYNNNFNYTLRISLFKALYSYDPEFYVDVVNNVPKKEIPTAINKVQKLHKLRKTLKKQLIKIQKKQAKYYNKRYKPIKF